MSLGSQNPDMKSMGLSIPYSLLFMYDVSILNPKIVHRRQICQQGFSDGNENVFLYVAFNLFKIYRNCCKFCHCLVNIPVSEVVECQRVTLGNGRGDGWSKQICRQRRVELIFAASNVISTLWVSRDAFCLLRKLLLNVLLLDVAIQDCVSAWRTASHVKPYISSPLMDRHNAGQFYSIKVHCHRIFHVQPPFRTALAAGNGRWTRTFLPSPRRHKVACTQLIVLFQAWISHR